MRPTVDELKSIPDLVMFALSFADKEETAKLSEFASNFSFETIKGMFIAKADKYLNSGPEVAWHEGGYDAVQIASTFYGGAFIRGGKAAKTTGEVDGFVGKIDNVLGEVSSEYTNDVSEDPGKLR